MYLENNLIRHYPVRAILAWISVAAWMALIFFFSNQPASISGQLSTGLARRLVLLFLRDAPADLVASLDGFLRSLAHGAIFFGLGLLLSWAFSEVAVRDIRNALLTFSLGLLYAGSDELHQSLVPGRASQWSDFMKDGIGILLAILVYQFFSTWRFLRADLRVKREEDLRI